MKLLLLFLLVSCQQLRVLDGDTIELNGERIRLEAIDCPEKSQALGYEAKKETESYKHLKVVRHGKDRYGRTLAFLYSDSVCVNEQLVKKGLAWAYGHKYDSLMMVAKNKRIGLWSKDYITPYQFRKLFKNN